MRGEILRIIALLTNAELPAPLWIKIYLTRFMIPQPQKPKLAIDVKVLSV